MRTLLAAAVFVPFALAAQSASSSPDNFRYSRPSSLKDGWKTASADSVGLDRAPLEALTRTLRSWPELGVHAVLIERGGALVYEEYFTASDQRWGTPIGRVAFSREMRHDLRSLTKSVISALAGIAIGEGVIPSLDRPVIEFFPEFADLNTPDRRRITLAHVLGMTSGLEWNENVSYADPRNDEVRMTRDSTPLRYALAPKFAQPPGAQFNYNGGLTHVMAAVLERTTRTSLEDYARTKLFEPLGISDVEWVGDLAGMPAAASGLRLRARDLAKFGSLYLHDGQWNGRQILPPGWSDRSTRRHARFEPSADVPGGQFGYGYFWWYNCYPTARGLVEARTAVGNGQQRIYVLPGLDMVVTIYAGRYNDVAHASNLGARILREHIIPAVKTGFGTGCPGA